MKEILEQCKHTETLCEFYNEPDADTFSVGYVIACDSEYYLIETVTSEGRHNGFQCFPVENLFKLQTGTNYIADIGRLMNYYNYEYSRVDIPLVGRDALAMLLNYAKNNKAACTIGLMNDEERSVFGFVQDLNDEYVTVRLYDRSGKEDGVGYVRTEDVTFVSVGGRDEIKLDILSK